MKRLEVYFDSFFLEKVKEELNEYGLEKYVLTPEVLSDWGKHLKHFNSHLWPGTDSILIAYLEDNQAEEIMRVIKKIKIDVGHMISMGAVLIPIDDMLL